MKVGGYLEMSTVDYPNKLCSVLFLFGCNLRCKFCFNWPLVIGNQFKEIPIDDIVARFIKYREFVNAITISGGEPCFQGEELKELIKLLKEKKFQVKLDTNGTYPEVLRECLKNLDFVALDIKANLDDLSYERVSGFKVAEKVRESYEILLKSKLNYEIRIPVVPGLNDSMIPKLSKELEDAKRVVLEQFTPENGTLDPNLNSRIPSRLEMMELAKLFKNEEVLIRTQEGGEECIKK